MRNLNIKFLASLGLLALIVPACNDLGVIPIASYADCDNVKDAVWLKLRQMDFGFFCRSCKDKLDCLVDEVCSDKHICYNPSDDKDACNPSLSKSQHEQLLYDTRVSLLAPLYECRQDELVATKCPDSIKRRAAKEFIQMMTDNECNPCDELTWRTCLCQFDSTKPYYENNMLLCLIGDGGRKANPLWHGYVQAQEIDCKASIKDFTCDAFFPEQ
ncbi:MAG: hypothetical protein GXP49_17065 [Deltaproteobacteria bacterium]|nr:hypothetical protein [Deltaproteobacteria bacterium]